MTLLRHLVSSKIEGPVWRRSRPHLLIEGSTFAKASPDAATGTLLVDAYVRNVGLSANRILAVPAAGDFQIDKIWAAPEQVRLKERRTGGMAVEGDDELVLLAEADGDRCACLS